MIYYSKLSPACGQYEKRVLYIYVCFTTSYRVPEALWVLAGETSPVTGEWNPFHLVGRYKLSA